MTLLDYCGKGNQFGFGGVDVQTELGGQPWSTSLRAEDQKDGKGSRSIRLRKRETEGERGRIKIE